MEDVLTALLGLGLSERDRYFETDVLNLKFLYRNQV